MCSYVCVCVCVDVVEDIAIERLCEIYGAKYANVQPHSGSSANIVEEEDILMEERKKYEMEKERAKKLTEKNGRE